MLDFTNTQTAFSIRSERDLRRAYFMYKIMSYPFIVKMANPLIKFASAIHFPINWIVKPTVYATFCGGETIPECASVIDKIKGGKVYSILDYSVEGSEKEEDINAALEETLRIKETDRILALQTELKKLGYILESDDGGTFLAWNKHTCKAEENPVIGTYHDHRMAMAFAIVALQRGSIIIDDPMVVTKSYPGFWEDLKKVGFGIEEV